MTEIAPSLSPQGEDKGEGALWSLVIGAYLVPPWRDWKLVIGISFTAAPF